LIFFALLIVVGFAAWNTGNNLLFLVFAFFISAFLVGTILGGMSIRGLDVRLRMPEFIFAEEETPITVSLVNRKRIFPTYSVLVELCGSERREGVLFRTLEGIFPSKIAKRLGRIPIVKHTLDHVTNVSRRSESNHRTRYVFKKRGRYTIKDFELSTTFPFGLLRHRRRLRAKESELVIYPPLTNAVSPRTDSNDDGSTLGSTLDIVGEFQAIREYRPTDDVRTIEWKATARTGKLMVRELAESRERKATIFVDRSVKVDFDLDDPKIIRRRIELERDGESLPEEKEFESMLSRVASTLVLIADGDCNFRLVAGAVDTGYGRSKSHLHQCLGILAGLTPELVSSSVESDSFMDGGFGDDVLMTFSTADKVSDSGGDFDGRGF
jgi:uncharacterized protein (DUF58 family)